MVSAGSISTVDPPTWLAERIGAHKLEMARMRLQFGDPEAALTAFARDHFGLEAFLLANGSLDDALDDLSANDSDDAG